MTIKAIETTYAGCRFRSRLEARWAVLFDRLQLGWEYEPQGFTFDGQCYLPDFLIEDDGPYVEVKGTDEAAHAALPLLRSFVANCGKALIVLSDIPRLNRMDTEVPLHGVLKLRGGFSTTYLAPSVDGRSRFLRGPDTDGLFVTSTLYGVRPLPEIVDAYDAARSARFEHGESGATNAAYEREDDEYPPPASDALDKSIGELFAAGTNPYLYVPWCGECSDENRRQVRRDDGRLERCPACHPLRALAGKP